MILFITTQILIIYTIIVVIFMVIIIFLFPSNSSPLFYYNFLKYFNVEKEDFYTVLYGNDYYDEVKFLRETLGLHRLLADQVQAIDRNPRPGTAGTLWILISSLAALVLFYYLFNRFFR